MIEKDEFIAHNGYFLSSKISNQTTFIVGTKQVEKLRRNFKRFLWDSLRLNKQMSEKLIGASLKRQKLWSYCIGQNHIPKTDGRRAPEFTLSLLREGQLVGWQTGTWEVAPT